MQDFKSVLSRPAREGSPAPMEV